MGGASVTVPVSWIEANWAVPTPTILAVYRGTRKIPKIKSGGAQNTAMRVGADDWHCEPI